MRLQLSRPGRRGAWSGARLARASVLAVVALAGCAGHAAIEQPTVAAVGARVYADDDRVTVWSPTARAITTAPRGVTIEAHATVDAVTAASIDVVSSASPYPFHEERVEGGAGASVTVADYQQIGVTAIVSDEHDYTALRLGARWRAELARRNTTVDVAYTFGLDEVGRVGDPGFARPRGEHRSAISVTQILDRRSYLDLAGEVVHTSGYQANPYRYVPITMGGVIGYVLPEVVPERRTAAAALVRLRRALADAWFGHGDYRVTRDTWGVTSHTASARLLRSFGDDDQWLFGAELRGYLQDGASFYRGHYAGDTGAPAWRTRDHALGGMRTVTMGATARRRWSWRDLEVTAALAGMHFRWLDDPRQRSRAAVVSSLTLLVPM